MTKQMLTKQDGKLLLELARKSIESYFSKKDFDRDKYLKFSTKQGVFVTLNKHGTLRGCIGFPYPVFELSKAVFDAARAAAFDDPRFPQLKKEELKEIDIEISVLTVPEEIKFKSPEECKKQIKIGEDGLIMKCSWTSGLLLPQVFTDYKCVPEEALRMTCEKAGLPDNAWCDKATKILKFQAQIFEENA